MRSLNQGLVYVLTLAFVLFGAASMDSQTASAGDKKAKQDTMAAKRGAQQSDPSDQKSRRMKVEKRGVDLLRDADRPGWARGVQRGEIVPGQKDQGQEI